MPAMAHIMQAVRDFRRSARSVRFKHMTKRAIDLVDGTTFRARPKPNPGGPTSAFYQQHGYAIFRNAIDRQKIDVLHTALEAEVIASDVAFLRHKSVKREPNVFLPDTRIPNDGLLNPHGQPEIARTAAAIESLLLTDNVADLLTSIDGAGSYTVHQTIVFFMPPGTHLHVDGWGFDTEPPGFAHTLWIPLEPVRRHNGPVAIVPWTRGKIVSPAELGVEEPSEPPDGSRRPHKSYHAVLEGYLREHAPDVVAPDLDPGDLVSFASTTPHRTLPFESPSRWAMQVLVRPSNLRWGSWPEFAAGFSNSPKDPWRWSKRVGPRWRIISSVAA
jgi:ectoine hydroxylase-related dioxygenase (phytanoyl-CoA dioxygenase family)